MSQVATPELSVPEFVKRGLKALAALPEDAVKELLAVLGEERATFASTDFSRRVASKVSGVEEQDVISIIQTLLSMYRARQDYGVSTDVVFGNLASRPDEFEVTSEQRAQIESRLPDFLNLESLTVTAKSFSILTSHERIFIKTQILTDMRPIFGDDDSGKPKAAVIVHMLKLTYRQDEEDVDFFVAMDTEDISKLRDVLDRADKKAASLQTLLEATDVPYLEVRREGSGS